MANSKSNPTVIPSSQYVELDNPVFIGQSKVNPLTGHYSMLFENNGIYYKTNNKLPFFNNQH